MSSASSSASISSLCPCFSGIFGCFPKTAEPQKKVKHTAVHTADKKAKIDDFFDIERKDMLGKGAFGSVVLATEKESGSKRAIKQAHKITSKGKDIKDRLLSEVDIFGSLHHPNIVQLYESFEDSVCVYMVMEVCKGGELFALLSQSRRLTEKNCSRIMQQLFYALNYMHKLKTCHRDLKPENLLLGEKVVDPSECDIKVADFGFAKRVDGPLKSKCGSPRYVAPEVLAGMGYDELCDMWSSGSLMYNLLSGQHAFPGRSPREVLSRVMAMQYQFPPEQWSRIKPDCTDLIRSLLVKRTQRISAQEALETAWVERQAPYSEDVHLSSDLLDNMKRFHGTSRLQQVALNAVATQLDQHEIKNLRDTFVSMDVNKDGHLSLQEFKEGIKKTRSLPPNFEEIWKEIDHDNDGFVDYAEFIASTLDKRHQVQRSVCWRAFRHFDTNKDGRITLEEFKKVLQDEHVMLVKDKSCNLHPESDLIAMGFGKGYISFDEFVSLINGTHEGSA